MYCLEPDYYAYKYLLWNIHANDLKNVIPFNAALAAETGLRSMGAGGNPLGSSHTTFVSSQEPEEQIDVSCISWSAWLDLTRVDRIDFIKMDIEGGEFELVPTMKDYLRSRKPIVYLSIHAPLIPGKDRGQQLRLLLDVMGAYPKCYDELRRPVRIASVEEDSQDRFRSYLFTK